jgi:hypothetical protein
MKTPATGTPFNIQRSIYISIVRGEALENLMRLYHLLNWERGAITSESNRGQPSEAVACSRNWKGFAGARYERSY